MHASGRRGRLRSLAVTLTDEIRDGAEWVAVRADHVDIDTDALVDYARGLPSTSPPAPEVDGDAERRAAFSLQLNAINFGSGWFPTLNKPDGLSGFRTVEKGLRDRGP